MNTQPNFEKFKIIVYNYFLNSPEAHFSLLGKEFKSIHIKRQEFLDDLNTFLNRLDIRTVPAIVKELTEKGAKFPAWMRENKYIIDYNKHGNLDLIRIPN